MPRRDIRTPHAAGSGQALARGVARGEAAALAAFYEAWFHRVYAAARKMTGRDESFCLDVVQEVMLKAARKLKPPATGEDLERWMARVIRTTAIDLLRREQRRSARERRVATGPAAPAPERHAEEEEVLRWLRAAAQLDRDADLLAQRLIQGRTLGEVAAITGLTEGAVHGRVRRAVDRLGERARELFV